MVVGRPRAVGWVGVDGRGGRALKGRAGDDRVHVSSVLAAGVEVERLRQGGTYLVPPARRRVRVIQQGYGVGAGGPARTGAAHQWGVGC